MKYCLTVIVCLLWMTTLHAQVMVSPTGKPAFLVICGDDGPFSLLVANTTGGPLSGATLTLDLPPSVRYTPGSVSGATEINIANLNHPVFSLPDILNNSAHPVGYQAKLVCGYTNTTGFTYIVNFNTSNYSGTDPPLQNYYFPAPVITNITNNSAIIPVNSTVTRNITIVQQGLNASLDTLYLLDQHMSDIQVLSCSPGTIHPYVGPGPVRVDTIILTGGDLPGGNGRFDPGESITVSETVRLVGCNNGQSTVKAAWGCNGELCNFYAAFASVSPAMGSPDISLAFTTNRRSWGFIDNSGFVEFTVTNTGSGLGGTAFDLNILSGFSSGSSTFYPNANWINKIDSFSVDGSYLQAGYNFAVGAVNGQYAFYTPLNYTFDPDGPGSGLEDADSDGYFDDLPAGQSFIIRAHTFYSWTQAVGSIATGKVCGQGWTNSAWQSLRYGYAFKNQCNITSGVNWVPNTNINQLMTYNTKTVQTTIPPDLFDVTPVWFEHSVITTTAVNNEGCPSDSIVYKVVLPPGVVIATGDFATFKGVSMGNPVISGDSVFYFLDKSRILSGGLFRVPVVAKCALVHPPMATIHAELKLWCDKINYINRYFTYWCGDSPLFGIQCPTGNCPDPSISLFKLKRKTLGWTNDRCTTRILPTNPGIRLDHAMSKDTITITAAGVLHGPVDSLFFRLKHNAIGGAWGNQLFFDYYTDTLRFYDVETSAWFTCTNLSPQIINAAASTLTTFFGDLTNPGGCLSGVSFTSGDSLSYTVSGIIKNIAQLEWKIVPALRADFYWKNQSVETSCNNLGSTFSVLGSNLPLSVSSNYQQIVIEGCGTFLYEGLVYRTLDVCGGDIGFPNEVRPFCLIDTITFTLPEGFVYQANSSTHSYYLDNGSYKTENIADPDITVGTTGTMLRFIRSSGWGFPDYYDCQYDHDRVRFYASPSCKATGNYSYGIDARGRYQYSADGHGVYKAGTSNIPVTYTPPLMIVSSLVGTAEGRQDTVTWKISLCNARTFSSTANWLGFESNTMGIDIVSVKDVTNPLAPVTLGLSGYGAGKKWAQLGSFNASQCREYEIRATYSVCSFDSVMVRHGSNCAGYPVNPELGYPPSAYGCSQNLTYLFLDPKPIGLNVTVISPVNPVNLCDGLDYEVEVTNSQLAYGYNVLLTIAIPPGMEVVPGFSQIKFPYSTGDWTSLNDPLNIPAGSNKWVYNISDDPNGVPILKGIDSIPKNGYRVKFRMLTNCDFTSGKALKISGSAINACGNTELRTSYSLPIVIDGLPTDVSLFVINTKAPDTLATCSENSSFRIKVINLGPNAVSSIEKIGLNLDDAFDYLANSLIGIHNGPSGIASNLVTAGVRYINFAIQPNLAVNDSIVFSFELHDVDPGSMQCDTIPIETTTLLVAVVNCTSAPGGTCTIQSITSSATNFIPVIKDHVAFGSYQAQSVSDGDTGEIVTIQYRVLNAGTGIFNTPSLSAVFLHDLNGNGMPDETGADSLFSQSIPVAALLPGDSFSMIATFYVPAGKVCQMLGAVRLTDNPCICGNAAFPITMIQNHNAGPDLTTCADTPLQIGTPGVQSYIYTWVPSVYLNSSTLAEPVFLYNGAVTEPSGFNYILQTTRPGDCISRDTATVTVYPPAISEAGPDILTCPLSSVSLSLSLATHYTSVLWTTSGNGIFDDPALLHPAYLPGTEDVLLGSVTLTLTAIGPCGLTSDGVGITFHTLPVLTNTALEAQVCSSVSPMILLSGSPVETTFSWTATGSSLNLSGFGPGNGPVIDQTLFNSGFTDEIVTYVIIPSYDGCTGYPISFNVTVHPVSDVYSSPAFQTICSGQSTGINLLSNVNGTTFTWTASSGSSLISGYSDGSGNQIAQELYNAGNVTESVIYTVTPSSFGCLPGIAQIVTLEVKPSPSVINNVTDFLQCSSASTSIILQSNFNETTYSWIATGSSPGVSGYSNGNGTSINQTLVNTAYSIEIVTYAVTPTFNNCTGQDINFVVSVNPVPDVYCEPPSQTICSGASCEITLLSQVVGAGFSWTCNGSSPYINGFNPGTGSNVSQVLNNTGLPGSVTYHFSSFINGCPGGTMASLVNVNPLTPATQIPCFDLVTTPTAKPYRLRGGRPLGGSYSGNGVNNDFFEPSLAGAGTHQLIYSYTNTYSCTDTALFTIRVQNNSFNCGEIMTDIRDGKQYETVLIGNRCWMAVNLNRGTTVNLPSMPQTDNCTTEKYCLTNDPGCYGYGGLYQWNELMSYGNTQTGQGICPPEWHIPTDGEWKSLITAAAAGIISPGEGVAAGFLKDPFLNPGFHAFPEGIYYLNNSWSFMEDPIKVTMYWTSEAGVPGYSVARGMNTFNTSVSRYEASRANAFPVRCVMDLP